MKTYKLLKELLFHLSDAQMSMANRFLEEMDDNDFREIPTLLITEETKKVLETYACILLVSRKDKNGDLVHHKIYFIAPTIFRTVV